MPGDAHCGCALSIPRTGTCDSLSALLAQLSWCDCHIIPPTLASSAPRSTGSDRVMRLPRRPRSVCSVCWKGPFAAQLGLLAQPVQQHKATDASTASWTGGYTYTTLWYTMTMSAALGCTWCQYLIPYALRARVYTKGAPRDAWSYGTLHFRVGREARVTAGIALCLVVNDVPVWDRSIWVYTTLDDPAAGFISERPRLTDVGSDRTLALAKQCSDHCAREHPRCRAISGNSGCFVPARLIDCRDPRRPRIILTMGAQHVYVALSYVWGEEQPHRTTDANLSSHMDGIDPTQLPCTIRDAILVTYKLGLSFLWADSLCIIQDSPMDKHRQLVSMHNVYRYAYLTIDAEIASKASDGFLRGQRPLRPLLIIPFICPANPENPRTEVGNLHLGRYSLDSATPWSSAISSRHTRTRAWCLQEALVSTRALAFTEHTVQLRCQTTIENMGRARHNTFSDAPRLPDAIFRTERDIEQYSDEWLAVRRGWYAIVAEYSHRRLSYPSDTLVACAGLAKMFAHALGSEYVAGLWNDDFILIDLLWCVEYNCCARRPQRYLAPSWSWASMGIGVDNVWCLDFPQRGSPWRKMAEVVSCRITPQDAAFPLGPVVSGLLVLRAHVLACKILQPETPLDRRLVVLGTGTTQANLGINVGFEEDVCDEGLWAVPIARFLGDYTSKGCWGLLIAPHSDALADVDESAAPETGGNRRRTVFRRVGHFCCRDRDLLETLGWDGEWSLETATQLELV